MTNRQIGAWKIDFDQVEKNSIDWNYRPICALDQPFGKLGFSHGFCFCKNNILTAVGGSKGPGLFNLRKKLELEVLPLKRLINPKKW